ncbi:DUF2520 domain-containing protein [Variovorax sp. efr-133-TYG-130]|uniref:DUF2520 domain-containing protein n=1 Tax=Variovorax sp. efr-133-TYG-130 TaxID=3040327 RepID=UPI002552BFC1|nr:DUF2520 domain-containing protein [Variovorax sp. efr-133-TYG-130]
MTIEASGILNAVLIQLSARVGCAVNHLSPGMRAKYHAAAYPSQHGGVLLGEAARIWQSWGADEEGAMRALLPLARSTLAPVEAVSIAKGMPDSFPHGDIDAFHLRKRPATSTALEPPRPVDCAAMKRGR